jgi:hypothetical protein
MRNKRYESYIEEAMSRNLKSMTSSIANADMLLDNVISKKTITREQVDQLYFQYHEFAYSIQELEHMYIDLQDKESMFNPFNQYHFELYEYFEHLRIEMSINSQLERELKDEEGVYYKRLFRLTESYMDILQKYSSMKLIIDKEDWVDLLNQLSNVDKLGVIKDNNALKL